MLENNEFDTFATKCARHNQPLRYVLFKQDFIESLNESYDKINQSLLNKNIRFVCDICPIKK